MNDLRRMVSGPDFHLKAKLIMSRVMMASSIVLVVSLTTKSFFRDEKLYYGVEGLQLFITVYK